MFSLCKKQIARSVFKIGLFPVVLLSFAGKNMLMDQQTAEWIQHCISGCFNFEGITKLKKWDFSVNSEGFLRLRKYYPNGKQEYFSFNLSRLHNMLYLGTVNSGYLVLRAKSDDIIVQTYNDRKGNIDTMATSLQLPVARMEPEQLDSLNRFLNGFKN